MKEICINLRESFKEDDIKKISLLILKIYDTDPPNFKKNLLLNDCIPEPTSRTFNRSSVVKLMKVFAHSLQVILNQAQTMDGNNIYTEFIEKFLEIIIAVKIIGQNLHSNSNMLNDDPFINLPLEQQLQMICIFLEDQSRLSNIKLTESYKQTGTITGLEYFIAQHDKYTTTSQNANFEASLEVADTIFRYLFYKDKSRSCTSTYPENEQITPYNNEFFEKIMRLGEQRNILIELWGKFKYRSWTCETHKDEENESCYVFAPQSIENLKKEQVASYRYYYQDFVTYNKHTKRQTKNVFYKFENVVKSVDCNIASLFLISKKDFEVVSQICKEVINAHLKSFDKFYLALTFDGIEVKHLINVFEYLMTISIIYQESVLEKFNQEDLSQYVKLAPIVKKKCIIEHFARIYDISIAKAEKMINLFVFLPKSKLDIFSQPLISVNSDKVIFCPTLINQVNISRNIEMYLTEWNIDLSEKGAKLEKQLKSCLQCSPFLEVNTNKIKFVASDKKQVEFDFIATFQDYLLLIELKHINRPYSDTAMRTSEDAINKGVKQVNRRCEVLINDWGKVKEMSNIVLPAAPYEKDKIIKLVCTNLFDFTGIIKDGVRIIDSSSLQKFFLDPQVDTVLVDDEPIIIERKHIWAKNYPTPNEFIDYCVTPPMLEFYMPCLQVEVKPVFTINENDNKIAFLDLILNDNPIKNMNETSIKNVQNERKKIGRNEKCPCGSNIKYKKCCGKS